MLIYCASLLVQYDGRIGSKISYMYTCFTACDVTLTFFVQGIETPKHVQVIIAGALRTLNRTKHFVKLQPDSTILEGTWHRQDLVLLMQRS